MKTIILLAALLLNVSALPAQDPIGKARREVQELIDLVKEPPKIQWNSYETKNFEILSIDDAQGKFLYDNIENMKAWCYTRWGIRDTDFAARCKIMVVPSKDLFVKLFAKDRSIVKNDIWLIADGNSWSTVSLAPMVGEICLSRFEQQYNVKFGYWVHRGMFVLNGNLNAVKMQLSAATFAYPTQTLFGLTAEDYAKLGDSAKVQYDVECGAVCLMVCKEMAGKKMLLDFMDAQRVNKDAALQTLRLQSYAQLDAVLNGYMQSLVGEIKKGVPVSYLTWD